MEFGPDVAVHDLGPDISPRDLAAQDQELDVWGADVAAKDLPPSWDGPFCGNGKKDSAEACDGSDLGGKTCVSEKFSGGKLACSACKLDTSGCTWVVTSEALPEAVAATTDAQGNSYVVGSFKNGFKWGTLTLKAATVEMFVVKLDPNGKVLWASGSTSLNSTSLSKSNAGAHAVALDSTGHVTVVGLFMGKVLVGASQINGTGNNYSDVFVARWDTGGTFVKFGPTMLPGVSSNKMSFLWKVLASGP